MIPLQYLEAQLLEFVEHDSLNQIKADCGEIFAKACQIAEVDRESSLGQNAIYSLYIGMGIEALYTLAEANYEYFKQGVKYEGFYRILPLDQEQIDSGIDQLVETLRNNK